MSRDADGVQALCMVMADIVISFGGQKDAGHYIVMADIGVAYALMTYVVMTDVVVAI